MEWITNLLQHYPELAIFITLALGFWIGKFKIKKFTLGTVTSVLLVGVLIGQLKIDISGPLKSVFFLMFLFAVGYWATVLPGIEKGRSSSNAFRRRHVYILFDRSFFVSETYGI